MICLKKHMAFYTSLLSTYNNVEFSGGVHSFLYNMVYGFFLQETTITDNLIRRG